MKGITDIDEGTLRRIDWQELCPPVILFRAFPFSLRIVQLGFISLLLTSLLSLGNILKLTSPSEDEGPFYLQGIQLSLWMIGVPVEPLEISFLADDAGSASFFFYTVFCPLVLMFFWLVFARSNAVRLVSTQQSGFLTSIYYATRTFPAVLLALSICTILIGGAWFAQYLAAGALRYGEWLRFVILPVGMIATLVGTFFKVILLFGFPLIIAAVAVDRCDGFDALSRTISYMTQRPLHFLLYWLLALTVGALGFFVTLYFSQAIWDFLLNLGCSNQINYSLLEDSFGWFCMTFIQMIPLAYFLVWSMIASTAIYYMLRKSLDGTPLEHFKPTNPERSTRKLQKILRDEVGAPLTPTSPPFPSTDIAATTGVTTSSITSPVLKDDHADG